MLKLMYFSLTFSKYNLKCYTLYVRQLKKMFKRREEDREARELGTQEQHIGELSAFLFMFVLFHISKLWS